MGTVTVAEPVGAAEQVCCEEEETTEDETETVVVDEVELGRGGMGGLVGVLGETIVLLGFSTALPVAVGVAVVSSFAQSLGLLPLTMSARRLDPPSSTGPGGGTGVGDTTVASDVGRGGKWAEAKSSFCCCLLRYVGEEETK